MSEQNLVFLNSCAGLEEFIPTQRGQLKKVIAHEVHPWNNLSCKGIFTPMTQFLSGMFAGVLLLSRAAYAGNAQLADSPFVDYDTLLALPYNSQISYLESVQDVLVEMDSDQGSSHAAMDWMLNQILCSADAAEQPAFCINLGVVQLAAECPAEFHGFNTADYFKKKEFDIGACAGGNGMPCSPFFGFQSDGSPFCSSRNLTRDCAKISAQAAHPIKLADLMKKCVNNEAFTAPAVSCKSLADFYTSQLQIVNQFCSAKSARACGRLRRQTDRVSAEVNKLDATKIAGLLGDTNAAKPVTQPLPDCLPGTQRAVATAPASAPANHTAAGSGPSTTDLSGGVTPPVEVKHQDCSAKIDMTDPKQKSIADDQDMYEIWSTRFPQNSPAGCGQFKTPSGFSLTLNKTALGLADGLVEFPKASDGSARKPVSLDFNAIQMMFSLSKAFESDNKTGVEPSELLKHYLPVTPIVKSDDITFPPKNGKTYAAVSYTTEDGTTIHYTKDEIGAQLVTVTPKGAQEQNAQVFYFRPRNAK